MGLPYATYITCRYISVTTRPKQEQKRLWHELWRPVQLNKNSGPNILLEHIIRNYIQKIRIIELKLIEEMQKYTEAVI